MKIEGTPYDMKMSRTVWSGGKDRDNLKILPIAISRGRLDMDFC